MQQDRGFPLGTNEPQMGSKGPRKEKKNRQFLYSTDLIESTTTM